MIQVWMERKRPRDFFGFDDYTYGDPQDDIDSIKRAQAEWDARYRELTWWQKLQLWMSLDGMYVKEVEDARAR